MSYRLRNTRVTPRIFWRIVLLLVGFSWAGASVSWFMHEYFLSWNLTAILFVVVALVLVVATAVVVASSLPRLIKMESKSRHRAQLSTILASMNEGVISIDDDQTINFCNEAAYRLLGVENKDVRGMNLSDIAGFDRLRKISNKASESDQFYSEELIIRHADPTPKDIFEIHVSPLSQRGLAGQIIVVHDISRLRRLEKMRRDFVANVSHEIKTPLTTIRGYVETLLSEGAEDPSIQKRFLEKIERNAMRLTVLVQDILSLAKIESDEELSEADSIGWQEIIHLVVTAHEDMLAEKSIALELPPPGNDLRVAGDRESMLQVLDNLVTNAIRYSTNNGKIKISLAAENGAGVITVTDNSIGIPAKYLDRVFERFYRVDKARSRDVGGTGLGLSIVKHLVMRMRGEISVESEEGRGSAFKVKMPLAERAGAIRALSQVEPIDATGLVPNERGHDQFQL